MQSHQVNFLFIHIFLISDFLKVVIEVSKKFLPSMAKSFSHPKVKKIVGDGIKFMKEYENYYDVIITDSSDPQGLFSLNCILKKN